MADPTTPRRAFDASRSPPQASSSPDQDTCRICRSESSPEEPLFYPCKCSGSIKYVHQNCLMEWLSHSQKKHCELCKTPFRFTKLYSPSMPKSLPVHVFVGHMAKHLVANLLVWLRALVVVSVWLGWLPYLMRSIWAFYFWLSDHGIGSAPALTVDSVGAYRQPYSGKLPATCASSPLLTTQTTDVRAVLDNDAFRAAGAHYRFDVTADPVSNAVIRLIFSSLQSWFSRSFNAVTVHTHRHPTLTLTTSLLADVSFFRNLTRWPAINSTAIIVAEGWIITAVVIVCFILIILVRDYVVQQQPEINMRAAFAAQNDAALIVNPGVLHIGDAENEVRNEPPPENEAHNDEEGPPPVEQLSLGDTQPSVQDVNLEGPVRPRSASETQEFRPQFFGEDTALYAESLRQNPSFRAGSAPIRLPSLEPEAPGVPSSDTASVSEFLALWREADSDPQTFLRIVKDRRLEARMASWISVTEAYLVKQASLEEEFSHDDAGGDEKGKKVVRDDQLDNFRSSLARDAATATSSGRSISEAPSPNATTSFLGNNTWSFDSINEHQNAVVDKLKSPADPSGSDTSEPSRDKESAAITGEPDGREQATLESGTPSVELDPTAPPAAEVDDATAHQNPTVRPPPPQPPRPPVHPQGVTGRIVNFMFADLDAVHAGLEDVESDGDDSTDDENGESDDDDDDDDDEDNGLPADGEGEDAGQEDEPDVIEDLEDFEGVMELIGMRGPIAGLFQNAIFCAVLVSVTIFLCVFLPYNIGRISIWFMANPSSLARLLLEFTRLVQDFSISLIGCCAWVTLFCASRTLHLAGLLSADSPLYGQAAHFRAISKTALLSIWDMMVQDFGSSVSDIQNFSATSHNALLQLKSGIASCFSHGSRLATSLVRGDVVGDIRHAMDAFAAIMLSTREFAYAASTKILDPSHWVISLGSSPNDLELDPELLNWPTVDRVWVIIIGYLTVACIAVWYLRRSVPLSGGQAGQQWEASIVDMLNQASGVVKVILVIGIEMLVFPLYCGMLLDAALLPLFENATFASRVLFTFEYPITSAFVHWFVGTGYMFHFALFVSMCRKIMRRGVLYFIRDPDDPDFHPVRDVLERSLVTQLRKILFSALVYGGLVIVCLGGVVWGLWYALPGVLPIHYSSNEPVLEFPIDLLFYNFVMPLAVRFFKPTNSLHAMYTWWFRTCARGLRLTWFLFGQRRIDEEGTLVLRTDSYHRRLPWWRTVFLKIDVDGKEVMPVSWTDIWPEPENGSTGTTDTHHVSDLLLSKRKLDLVSTGQLVRSGRFVHAPASDQVKILRGMRVFHELGDDNSARDEQTPSPNTMSPSDYQTVYIPPNFSTRIFLFILFMWLFAAVTGVALTIVPLVFGRRMFRIMLPDHIRTNDIYAFSIGIYILGSALYLVYHVRGIALSIGDRTRETVGSWWNGDTPRRLAHLVAHGVKLAFAYVALIVVFPLLLAAIVELYLMIPLHTLMYPPAAADVEGDGQGIGAEESRHTVRVIQVWTLGVLYLKLAAWIITEFHEDSRPAMAIQGVMRHGWLRPNVSLLTRAFIIPGMTVGCIALFGPSLVTQALIARGALPRSWVDDAASVALTHRAAYPAAVILVFTMLVLWGMVGIFNRWTTRIRDEAYLIGERLHNFGVVSAGTGKGKAPQWRAAGARL